jgi:hypothetical protein
VVIKTVVRRPMSVLPSTPQSSLLVTETPKITSSEGDMLELNSRLHARVPWQMVLMRVSTDP